MANYEANARSNYFRVKDVEALKASLAKYGLTTCTTDNPYAGDLMIVSGRPNRPADEIVLYSVSGGWPSLDEDSTAARLELDDVDDETWRELGLDDTTLSQLVSEHLVDGEVAIFVEIGSEKARYLGGVAVAVNAAGESRRIDLDDIVDLARELTTSDHKVTHPSH